MENINEKNYEIRYYLYYDVEGNLPTSILIKEYEDGCEKCGRRLHGEELQKCVEYLKDDIENDECVNVYASDTEDEYYSDDEWVASFKTLEDAQAFAKITDKDVQLIRWFEKNGQEQ